MLSGTTNYLHKLPHVVSVSKQRWKALPFLLVGHGHAPTRACHLSLSYSRTCTPYTRRPYIQWWKASPFHAHWPWSHNRHMCAIVLIYAVRHTSYVCGRGLHPRIHITLGRKKGDTTDSSELSCVQARLVWLRHGRCASLTQ